MTLLGIDIGGTGIKGAPVDVETGQLVGERFRLETPQPSVPNAARPRWDTAAARTSRIAEHFNYRGPAGVTFPAVVKHGVTYTAANVDRSWIGTNAGELFSQHVGGPVTVVNDADAAGVAEIRFGAGKDRKGVIILLTLGTGIGSAVFLDGKLLPNSEFGHLKIRGKEAEKRASERVRELRQLSWKEWAERLSEFLNELEKLFSPDLFIMGGGISKKAEKFFPYLKTKTEVIVVPAQMRNEAGIIGAAYLAHISGQQQ